ncbi:MAG: ABC transporter permease [Bacteroidota bacterium]
MLKNNIKTAFRNMRKRKSYAFLNLAGLSTGLAVCLLLSLWVKDELSYDQFHDNSDRIYRALWDAKYGENTWTIPQVPVPLAATLKQEFPEVETITQVYEGSFTLQKGTEYVREKEVLFVDPSFFEIFSATSLTGDAQATIQNPNTVILTRSSATKYFGTQQDWSQLIGKNLTRNNGELLQVGGIIEDFPKQSHLQFDFLAPITDVARVEQRKEDWASAAVLTYFLRTEKGSAMELAQKVQTYFAQNVVDELFSEPGNYSSFPFEPIQDIYLQPRLSSIWIFGTVAAFILLLACINFINLTTAGALTRMKEVGIRKVLGSNRRQLIQQFFSEFALYVFIAVVLAVLLAWIALPAFNALADKSLRLNLFSSNYIWVLIAALITITTLLAGVLPAWTLSAFSPTQVIKGQLLNWNSKNWLRQGMVIFQFCVSCGLIMATLIVGDQLKFLQTSSLGFDQEHVLIVRGARALGNNYSPFLARVSEQTNVQQVSTAQTLPGDEFDSTIFEPEQPANYKSTSLTYAHIDMNFVQTLDLEIANGRDYNTNLSTDSTAYLINQEAATRLGWDKPIGKTLLFGGYEKGQVIGVVKDFNFNSLHETIEPLVLKVASFNLPNIVIRLNEGDLQNQVVDIRSVWTQLAPDAPFEFAFLDDTIQQQYEQEARMSSIFTIFAGLAIFIACLGLFGLTTFMVQRKVKEIGIRKVLGASVTGIVALLSKDFIKLVAIAFLIATPIAYYFMNEWLQDFAYRIELQWWVFALAGLAAIGIALLTVSVQSVRAALANPVESLKNE